MKGAKLKVCLVAAYLGPLPPYFSVWARSCGGNPSIDWLLFTDTPADRLPKLPENLKAVQISFPELRRLICDRLNLEICLPTPYKLCDFKVAYGVIFADWLKDYDFWGYCDMDVVWGNLRAFFSDEILSSNDKLQECGHLTLLRNVESINRLYMQCAPNVDYRHVFTDPRSFSFDEHGGVRFLTYLAKIRHTWIAKYCDVDPSRHHLTDCRKKNFRRQIFYWEDGHLYREYVDEKEQDDACYRYPNVSRDEFAYIHFQKRNFPAPHFDIDAARGFYITPYGFQQKLKYIHELTDFLRLNPRSATYKPVLKMKTLAGLAKLTVTDLLRG